MRKGKICNALTSQNWYPLFKKRFRENRRRDLISDDMIKVDLISRAFIWFETEEGENYWTLIDRYWREIYRSIE